MTSRDWVGKETSMRCVRAVLRVGSDSRRYVGLDRPSARRSKPSDRQTGSCARREPLLIGDLILLEVLQGARNEAHALRIERGLRSYAVAPLLDAELAVQAARNYRKLRELGVTIRKTADLIIGTFCIEHGHSLLHDDHDFALMERHLGLKVV
jgi:predicted nucleic acid-binding protein